MGKPTPNPAAGDRFGRLVVTDDFPIRKGREIYFSVKCDCGKTKVVGKGSLRSGASTSCGCYRVESSKSRATHGKTNSPIYAVWNMMKQRCSLPSNRYYEYYGGRGIKVCERWHAFENFYADVGEPPFPRATLDRKDNNKDYGPDNVKWATYREQQRNSSKTVVYDFEGEKLILTDITKRLRLNHSTIANRIYGYGMTLEDALSGKSPASLGYDRVMARKAGDKLYPKDAA